MPSFSSSALRLLNDFAAAFDRRANASGRCYHCEGFTAWIARDGFYRCTRCGSDPLHDRPEAPEVARSENTAG